MDYATLERSCTADLDELDRLLEDADDELARLDLAELERLASLHRRVMGTFAYARTHFADTGLAERLRASAFRSHRLLAARPVPWRERVATFFRRDFLLAFRETLPSIQVAALVFVGFTLVGFCIELVHVEFVEVWVGPDAISGLRHGEIWTDRVGSMAPASVLSSTIATNNIGVAFAAWAGGVLAGIGSLYILAFNGMMFGGMLAATHHYELLDQLFAFISAHGPLELSLIVVAGGAGLELAGGLLRDEGRPRAEALQDAARRSVRVALGIAPWLLLLGFVEGFVSPDMAVPTVLKALLGALLWLGFVAYTMRPGMEVR